MIVCCVVSQRCRGGSHPGGHTDNYGYAPSPSYPHGGAAVSWPQWSLLFQNFYVIDANVDMQSWLVNAKFGSCWLLSRVLEYSYLASGKILS